MKFSFHSCEIIWSIEVDLRLVVNLNCAFCGPETLLGRNQWLEDLKKLESVWWTQFQESLSNYKLDDSVMT